MGAVMRFATNPCVVAAAMVRQTTLIYIICITSVQMLLLWCALLGTSLNATQLLFVSRLNVVIGVSDKIFVLGDYAMLSTLGEVGVSSYKFTMCRS